MKLCTCLPWQLPDMFPVFDIWGNETPIQTWALIVHSMVTWFSCKLCQTKIISLISVWFRFQEESHEMKLGTCLSLPDTIFPVFGTETESSNQTGDLIFNLWLLVIHVIYAWPNSSQCDLGVKRNHMKWCWVHVYHNLVMIHCFIYLILELRPQIKQELWFFNLWSQDCHLNYARPKSC